MYECPNMMNGVVLGQFHPGQEEIKETQDRYFTVWDSELKPGFYYKNTRMGEEEPLVEILEVHRKIYVEVPKVYGPDFDPKQFLIYGINLKTQTFLTVNETAKQLVERIGGKLYSEQITLVKYRKEDGTVLETRYGGFSEKREVQVVTRKGIRPHIHNMEKVTTFSRCEHQSKCTICGATYYCDSGD